MNGNAKGEHEMNRERYSIIFSSLTGKTRQLADVIYETLLKENCDYFGVKEIGQPQSEMLYIGFWTDKGNADQSTLELLSSLKNKKIFLFREPLVLVEVIPIFKRYLSMSDNLSMKAIRL